MLGQRRRRWANIQHSTSENSPGFQSTSTEVMDCHCHEGLHLDSDFAQNGHQTDKITDKRYITAANLQSRHIHIRCGFRNWRI